MGHARKMRRAAERGKLHAQEDDLYVYSAGCSWHGPFSEAKVTAPINGHSLPCCPHCGSVLCQYDNRAEWDKAIASFLDARPPEFDRPLYLRWLQWLHDRGTCERLADWDWRKSMADFGGANL